MHPTVMARITTDTHKHTHKHTHTHSVYPVYAALHLGYFLYSVCLYVNYLVGGV